MIARDPMELDNATVNIAHLALVFSAVISAYIKIFNFTGAPARVVDHAFILTLMVVYVALSERIVRKWRLADIYFSHNKKYYQYNIVALLLIVVLLTLAQILAPNMFVRNLLLAIIACAGLSSSTFAYIYLATNVGNRDPEGFFGTVYRIVYSMAGYLFIWGAVSCLIDLIGR